MNKYLVILFLLLLPTYALVAQVLPAEDAKLNYRLIGFSVPHQQNVNDYRLEISEGNFFDSDSFNRAIILSLHSRYGKTIAEVPAFGRSYTWRVAYTVGHSKIEYSPLYHFATGKIPMVDSSLNRLRITNPAKNFTDAYVFLDGTMVMYDMKGNPIWYLPELEVTAKDPANHRDMKLTDFGTITFITATGACEVNYDGHIVWKAPDDGKISGDTSEFYHHEFTRLSNGHYMIMGSITAPVYIKYTTSNNHTDSTLIIGANNTNLTNCKLVYDGRIFGTVIEYDEAGKAVWSYNTARYYTGSDLIHHKNILGKLDLRPHDNGFYLDEKNQMLYISFRDFSRVIKVKYPEGNTINTFGRVYNYTDKPSDKKLNVDARVIQSGNGMFCYQHCCRSSKHGLLYLYNNNLCNPGSLPQLVMMRQPVNVNDSLEKVWVYDCQLENSDINLKPKPNFATGGSVEELPDGSLFACMGNGYGKVFIVDQNKETIWSAMSERWNDHDKKWELVGNYRTSIVISREALERFVWNVQPR